MMILNENRKFEIYLQNDKVMGTWNKLDLENENNSISIKNDIYHKHTKNLKKMSLAEDIPQSFDSERNFGNNSPFMIESKGINTGHPGNAESQEDYNKDFENTDDYKELKGKILAVIED